MKVYSVDKGKVCLDNLKKSYVMRANELKTKQTNVKYQTLKQKKLGV